MASRVLFLFAVLLLARDCKCNTRDNFLEDYYSRLLFQNSGRISEKRNDPSPTKQNVIEPELPSIIPKIAVVQGPSSTHASKEQSKRTPYDTSVNYSPDLTQEILDSIGRAPKNWAWPCYCKYLL